MMDFATDTGGYYVKLLGGRFKIKEGREFFSPFSVNSEIPCQRMLLRPTGSLS